MSRDSSMTKQQKNQNRPWSQALQLVLDHGGILPKADGWKGELRMSKDAWLGPPGEARVSKRQTSVLLTRHCGVIRVLGELLLGT